MKKIIAILLLSAFMLTSCNSNKKGASTEESSNSITKESSEIISESSEEISESSEEISEPPKVERQNPNFPADKVGMSYKEYNEILESLDYKLNNAYIFRNQPYRVLKTDEEQEIYNFISPFLILNDTSKNFSNPQEADPNFRFMAATQYIARPSWSKNYTPNNGNTYYETYLEPKLAFLQGTRPNMGDEGYPVQLIEKVIRDIFGDDTLTVGDVEKGIYILDEQYDIYYTPGTGIYGAAEPIIMNIDRNSETITLDVASITLDMGNTFVDDNGQTIQDVDKYLKEDAKHMEIILKVNEDGSYTFYSLQNK